MTKDDLSDYEQAAAVVTPALAALEWIHATLTGDFDTSWGGLDPTFRLAVVQEWISSNPRVLDLVPHSAPDDVAAELADRRPTHWLWHEHGQRVVQRNLEQLVEGLRGMQYGHGIKPRFVAPDLEVVVFFDLDGLPTDERGVHYLPPGEGRPSSPMIMRLDNGRYVVRGVGMGMWQPGWPPTYVEVLRPED